MKVFKDMVKPISINFKTADSEVNIQNEIFNPINSITNKEMNVEKWTKQLEDADTKLRQAAK